MQTWMAHTEREDEPVTGSTRRVEADSAADAARRAAAAYWNERPTLFDRVDTAVRQVVVAVQPTTDGHRRNVQEATSRWRCRVTVASDADTENVSIHVEPL